MYYEYMGCDVYSIEVCSGETIVLTKKDMDNITELNMKVDRDNVSMPGLAISTDIDSE